MAFSSQRILFLAVALPLCGLVACQAPEQSVKPGINDPFLGATAEDVETFVGMFEAESREIAASSDGIMAALNIQPGMEIGDIGAGTGLYEPMFNAAVGEHGTVYAIDLSPAMIDHLEQRVLDEKLEQVKVVQCSATSSGLAPNSVDLIYVCDTYHHFEYPMTTLRSIRSALRSGGTLAIVDFERIEGESRPWIMKHMRAGKEVFRAEIEEAGFEFMEEPEVDGLSENYLMLFRRP
ncbi:MAG: class I SAM-dependent methyltransferase [Planctomycetota bacterium]|nr:class I SAM-dependent methyltransferase [Planctomycetota bacterium]MDA1114755.1 class I SAM-dependent methyltransferase [Planctomycetota bacterium]